MTFLKTFFISTLTLTSILYGFIYSVDPYNKFGINLFKVKTKAVDFARENKFNQVEHSKIPYELFLMGSSSAHRYWTKDLKSETGYVSYNYSTQSATPEDYLAMTRHILQKGYPLKMIILSIDFEALSEDMPTDDMFYSSPLKNYLSEEKNKISSVFNNSYFSLKALSDSFNVLFVNYFGKPQHTYLEHGDHIVEPLPKSLKVSQFHHFKKISLKRLEYLREIQRLSKAHHFRIIAFTSPLSFEHILRIENDPELKKNHQEFKQALASIFEEVYDFQNLDIKPYDSLDYFRDSNHPRHEFSHLILKRIFHPRRDDTSEFGRKLSF